MKPVTFWNKDGWDLKYTYMYIYLIIKLDEIKKKKDWVLFS